MPLFGIDQPGITLIDCPGTHENNLLSAKAVTYTQMASIIIYVFRISTGISIQVCRLKFTIKFRTLTYDI